MTNKEPLYPLSSQPFDEIREEGYVYVDKTEYMYKIVQPFQSAQRTIAEAPRLLLVCERYTIVLD